MSNASVMEVTNDIQTTQVEEVVKKSKPPEGIKNLLITDDDINGLLSKRLEPYSHSLEQLTFQVSPKRNLDNCWPLGEMPKLWCFTVQGKPKPGTLAGFFRQASQKPSLTYLELEDVQLDALELGELAKIGSLECVECGVSDCEALGQLTALTKLHTLDIISSANDVIIKQVTEILSESKRIMHILLRQGDIEFCLDWNPPRICVHLSQLEHLDISFLAPLANLQDLKYLTLRGYHMMGSLEALFTGFGKNESSVLEEIVIYNKIPFTNEEVAAMSTIKSLVTLECGFGDSFALVQLSDLPQIRELCMVARPEGDFLQLALKALASKSKHTLEFFVLTDGILSGEESAELAKIKSLRYVASRFSHIDAVKQLSKLKNLECGYISVKQREFSTLEQAGHLLKFLKSFRKEVQVRYRTCNVSYSPIDQKLTIYFKANADVLLLSQVGCLRNLKSVVIQGRPTIGEMGDLLNNIQSQNELEELEIQTLRADEISCLIKMKSLRVLKVGFPGEFDIQLLAEVPHLERLILTEHTTGELEALFRLLANREPPSELECLVVLGIYLMPEELVELSKIRSLKRLLCALIDTTDECSLDALSSNSQIEELSIKSYRTGSLRDVFKALQELPTLRRLVVFGNPLDTKEVRAIKRIPTLKILHCSFMNSWDIDRLARIPELEELLISRVKFVAENALGVLARKKPQTLRKMCIKTRTLGKPDFRTMLSMTSLESLECTIGTSANSQMLAYLNLTELILHVPPNLSMEPLFLALAEREPQILTNFALCNKYIKLEQARMLGHFVALKKLKIGFTHADCFEFITQLTQLEILDLQTKNYRFQEIERIIQSCSKLEQITFHRRDHKVNTEFFKAVKEVVKAARDPKQQKPLQMLFHSLHCVSLNQEFSMDEDYLQVQVLLTPLLDNFYDIDVIRKESHQSIEDSEESEIEEQTDKFEVEESVVSSNPPGTESSERFMRICMG